MATLQGFEYYLSTGAPVVGAAVDYWPAVLGTPGGASSGSTTTDANGRWTFAPGTAGQFDVRVVLGGRTKWYKGLSATSLQELYVNGTLRIGGAAIFDGLVTLNAGMSLAAGALAGFPLNKLGEVSVVSGSSCGLSGLSTGGYDHFLAMFQGYHDGVILGGTTPGRLFMRLNNLSDAHYDWQKTTFQQSTTTQTEGLNANEWDVGMIPGNGSHVRDGLAFVFFNPLDFQSWFSWNVAGNPTTGQVRHGLSAGGRDLTPGALTQVSFHIESAASFALGQMNLYGIG